MQDGYWVLSRDFSPSALYSRTRHSSRFLTIFWHQKIKAMDSTLEAAESVKFHDVKRLGEIEKCPVCGSKADAGAYHCSQCRNNFCYRCRARVLPAEPQFQCINQKCDYYGKLVCGICDPAISQPEPPTIYLERIGGWWPPLLAGSVVIFLLGLFWLSFWYAFLLGLMAFSAIGYWLDRMGFHVLGQIKTITETRESVHHDCIRCGHQVKKSL